MWLPPNPWIRGCDGGSSSWVCWGLSQKNSEKIPSWEGKRNHKKMVFLTDMWWGTDLGLSWFGRPFAPETRLKKGIFPINQRKMGTACNKARCIHVGLHVSFIPKASLSLRDHKSSTKSVFIKEKYREFLSFPRGEILMLCGKSRGQAYVWSTTGCCC